MQHDAFYFHENNKDNQDSTPSHHTTVWKNEKFSLTKKISRQINYLVTYLVKPLL